MAIVVSGIATVGYASVASQSRYDLSAALGYFNLQLCSIEWCYILLDIFFFVDSSSSSVDGGKASLGILLVLSSQIISATQMVLEETYLKERKLPALLVTGMEGVIGTVLMIFFVLPLVYVIPGSQRSSMSGNSVENPVDAFVMMGNNSSLLLLCIFYTFSIAVFNFCGQSITKHLSAVHRTLIDSRFVYVAEFSVFFKCRILRYPPSMNSRTIVVWCVELLMYYGFDNKDVGEEWNEYRFFLSSFFNCIILYFRRILPFALQYFLFVSFIHFCFSPIQLAGFGILLFGTCMYNGVIKFQSLDREVPCLTRGPKTDGRPMTSSHE